MPYGFNSILIDRGDRVSIQGDGHPTMAAALSAFGSPDVYANFLCSSPRPLCSVSLVFSSVDQVVRSWRRYELVHTMLKKTDSGCANQTACNVVDDGLMT